MDGRANRRGSSIPSPSVRCQATPDWHLPYRPTQRVDEQLEIIAGFRAQHAEVIQRLVQVGMVIEYSVSVMALPTSPRSFDSAEEPSHQGIVGVIGLAC